MHFHECNCENYCDRKNRDVKGSRAEFFGSNTNSNGDLLSRSSFFFRLRFLGLLWMLILRML